MKRRRLRGADLVREIRSRLGLTQEQLAARLGVTFPTINRWENSRANPSPLARMQIKRLLAAMGKEGGSLRSRYFPRKTV